MDDEEERKPVLSNSNLLINELIREYLEFNHYRHTLSVFVPESGQPEQPPFDREFMGHQLNVPETEETVRIPLLYSLMALMQSGPEALQPKLGGRKKRGARKGKAKRRARAPKRREPEDMPVVDVDVDEDEDEDEDEAGVTGVPDAPVDDDEARDDGGDDQGALGGLLGAGYDEPTPIMMSN